MELNSLADEALEMANNIQAKWAMVDELRDDHEFRIEVECLFCGADDYTRAPIYDDNSADSLVEEAIDIVTERVVHSADCCVLTANAHVARAMDSLFKEPDPEPELPDAGEGFVWVTNENGASFRMPNDHAEKLGHNIKPFTVDTGAEGYMLTHADGSGTFYKNQRDALNAAQSNSQVTRHIKDTINSGMTADKKPSAKEAKDYVKRMVRW